MGRDARRLTAGLLLTAALGVTVVADDPETGETDARPEIVVTANRIETPLDRVGASVSRIEGEAIERAGHTEMQEVLRSVPGLHMVRTANRGGTTSLFTRGGESNFTAVLLDGFRINVDGGSFDFENLTVDGIDRVEVVRGAAGPQYGSDAMTGVINIISRRGEGPPTVRISTEAGNLGTFRERVRLDGGTESGGYALDLSYLEQMDGRYDNSDYEDLSLAGRLDHRISPTTDLTVTLRSLHSRLGVFTTSSGQRFDPPDPNDDKKRNDLLTGFTIRTVPGDRWTSELKLFRYLHETKFDTEEDVSLGSGNSDSSDTFNLTDFERTGADWQNTIDFSESVRLLAGVLTEHEAFMKETVKPNNTGSTDVDETRSNHALYLQTELSRNDRLFVTLGGRVDENSDFDTEFTGRTAVSYLLPTETRLRSSFGNGIKVPTFREIHGTSTSPGLIRNPDGIEVERSRTFDAGINQSFADGRLRLAGTGFYNVYDDLVEFESSATGYSQGGRAFSRGGEFEIGLVPHATVDLALNWTYLETRVTETRTTGTAFVRGEPLLRRPRNAGSATLTWIPGEAIETSMRLLHVGDRIDRDFNASGSGLRITNDAYVTLEASVSWRFREDWRLFASGQNLTDTHYEEAYGFPSDHATFLTGVEYTARF